jgi:hypothetical protein
MAVAGINFLVIAAPLEAITITHAQTEDAPDGSGASSAVSAVESVAREQSARITATLIGSCGGDFRLAEDALQDALAIALSAGPMMGFHAIQLPGSSPPPAAEPSTGSAATRCFIARKRSCRDCWRAMRILF